jgi:hypothetical protein
MMTETVTMESGTWAAIAPIAVLASAFAVYCLFDLSRSEVRYLPKWAWAVLCVVSIPFGGVLYLLVGKVHR